MTSILRNLLAGASLAVAMTGQALATDVWRGYTYVGGVNQAAYRGLVEMGEKIGEATKGRVKIDLSAPGSLPISTQAITQAVADGILQFAADGFAIGNVPVNGLYRLPLLMNNNDEALKALETLRPDIDSAYAKNGVTVLAVYLYPAQTIWSTTKLTSLEDIKGKKLRVTSPEQGDFVRELGGIPVTISAPDVPSALQSGVVEGVLTASTGGGVIWKDQLKYNYRFPVNYFHSIVIVNSESFESLSKEDQEAIRAVAEESVKAINEEQFATDITMTEDFAKNGMVITEPSADEIAAARAAYIAKWDEWSAKQPAEIQQSLKHVREALGR